MPACRPVTAVGRRQTSPSQILLLFLQGKHSQASDAPSLFVPEPGTSGYQTACRPDKWWRFFPLYGCGKNTTAWLVAWTGHVWPVTIHQATGGRIVCFCSDPIPPVAVATAQPAKRVLSRSAGGKRSSSIILCIRGWFIQHLSNRFRTQVDPLISPILGIFQDIAANESHI